MNSDTRDTVDQSGNLPLPELTSDRIQAVEVAVFREISHAKRSARSRRRGIWVLSGAAAAVIIVAAVIAPNMPGIIGSAGSSAESSQADAPVPGVDLGAGGSSVEEGTSDGSVSSTDEAGRLDAGDSAGESAAADRDIIATASATVTVDDVAAAAKTIASAATDRGGYVESMSVGASGAVTEVDPESGAAYDSMTYPYPPDGAWITVRIPSDELTGLIDGLAAVGGVSASTVDRYDVTAQTVDLQARIDAAQASVDRLTELMTQAGDLGDLIAAESALAERQATLESYQSEREMLEDQVAMSSLTVTLQPETEVVEADPAGFTDGFVAGWNGLVATLNGIVIALGFLLPWLVVLAVIGVVVWAIRRSIQRRRVAAANVIAAPPASEAPGDE